MKPFIVIPNLNGSKYLAESLQSLKFQSASCQIVVVDNGSTDDSTTLVRTSFPDVHLIELDRNYGFAGGVNRGIEYALTQNAKYIILFNNDAVADKDWVKKLVTAANHQPEAGIVTGKFMRIDRKHLDTTGDWYSIWGFSFPRGRDELDTGQYQSPEWVFGGSGGASLYRVDMLRQVGLFDEEFFAYYEDIDLSFRAQLAGWKTYYEPDAVAYHHVGATSSKMGQFARYQSVKNFFYLYTKNMPTKLYWKYLPRFLLGVLMMLINSIRRAQTITSLKAYGRVIITLPLTIVKRWRIQRMRSVSSEYIDSILYHQVPPTQKALVRVLRKLGRPV